MNSSIFLLILTGGVYGPCPWGLYFAKAEVVQKETVERLVVLINDEPVFLSDVRKRALPVIQKAYESFSGSGEIPSPPPSFYNGIVEQLIIEQLLAQEAKKLEVRVTREDIDRMISRIREENNLSEEDFSLALKSQGLSVSEHRKQVRKQLLRLKLLNTQVRSKVRVTEQEVRRVFNKKIREINKKLRFRVAHILFPVSTTASPGEIAKIREDAVELRMKLNIDNFLDEGKQRLGGELGWLSQGDLQPELEKVLLELPVGAISVPVRGSSGIHIFWLQEREKGDSQSLSFDNSKDEIYREILDSRLKKQEEVWLTELKNKALIRKVYTFE